MYSLCVNIDNHLPVETSCEEISIQPEVRLQNTRRLLDL